MEELPTNHCVSCEKLLTKRRLRLFSTYKDKIDNLLWTKLLDEYERDENNEEYICEYCLKKFKENKMPSWCFLNRLKVKAVPECLSNLNMFEKILIQRYKAFQVVHKFETKLDKSLPSRCKLDAVKGQTFHLPIPLQETLNKVALKTEPINNDHELYILVRDIPNKANVVWESLVDLKKVWEILEFLKQNNPLYEDIILPEFQFRKNLLSNLKETQFKIIDDKNKNSDVEKNPPSSKPMESVIPPESDMTNQNQLEKPAILTAKSSTDPFYDFCIFFAQSKKNEDSSTLFQMLKVYDQALQSKTKNLDVKCFPCLFPYGKYGMDDEKRKLNEKNKYAKLNDSDFIKSRLLSKHSIFRSDIQYLFFLLQNDTMRRLNAGILQTMNVVNPRFKHTAKDFLQKLSDNELERNLDTVFSRLPNTEQYWKQPRNNLNCMVDHYGPAHVFLTISPGEWNWTELGEYLKKFCKPEHRGKTTTELVVLEPVLAAVFIETKFQATLEFILSSDNPLGKVTHYFWRREYQGRGMDHFHLVLWIEDGPVLEQSPEETIRSYILQHMSCRIPDPKISPELHRKVEYQVHRCNGYCKRRIKTKTGFRSVCRFSFPRKQRDSLHMYKTTTAIVNRRKLKKYARLYDLP